MFIVFQTDNPDSGNAGMHPYICVDDPIKFGCEILASMRFRRIEKLLPNILSRRLNRLDNDHVFSHESTDNGRAPLSLRREATPGAGAALVDSSTGGTADTGGRGGDESPAPPARTTGGPSKKADSRRRSRCLSWAAWASICMWKSSLISSRTVDMRRMSRGAGRDCCCCCWSWSS